MADLQTRLEAGVKAAQGERDIARMLASPGGGSIVREARFTLNHMLEKLVLTRILAEQGHPGSVEQSDRITNQLVELMEHTSLLLKQSGHLSDSSNVSVAGHFLKQNTEGLHRAIDEAIGKTPRKTMVQKHAQKPQDEQGRGRSAAG